MASRAELEEFQRWWDTEGDWVEEPNERRKGMSGVQRIERDGKTLYVKRQVMHLFHSLRYPFGRPTIVREIQVINELSAAGVIVPKIVYGKALQINGEWRALLVTEDMKDFVCIGDWYTQKQNQACEPEVMNELLKQIAVAFKKMHSVNRQHGCCYVRHIYVKSHGDVQAGFLDLEKSRRRWVREKAVQHDFKQLEKYLEPIPTEDWLRVKEHYYSL